jgi:hypothetical protein
MSEEEKDLITQEERASKNKLELWADEPHREFSLEQLNTEIKTLVDDYVDQFPPESSERSKAAKDAKKTAQALTAYLDKQYKPELSIKKDYEPPMWMQQASIKKALDKTRFHDVWNYIQSHTVPYEKGLHLAQSKYVKTKKKTINGHERDWVIFIPDYADMMRVLKISKHTIGNYLRNFMKLEIIYNIGKHGENGNIIYALGYWTIYLKKDGTYEYQRIWFLKETPQIKAALRNFMSGNR